MNVLSYSVICSEFDFFSSMSVVYNVSCVGISLLPTTEYCGCSCSMVLLVLTDIYFMVGMLLGSSGGGGYIIYGMGWGCVSEGALFGYILLLWVCFITGSNIGLCMSVKVLFICNFCLLKLCLWKCSSVFSNWPFFLMCRISNA
jgi:hypothetical protein